MSIIKDDGSSVLEHMNLHEPTQFDELLRQRILCGWSSSRSDIESWRSAGGSGSIGMFWIVPPSAKQLPVPQRYAGHIMGNIKTEPRPGDDADKMESVFYIWNLFVLQDRRRGGLGRIALQEVEALARVLPYGSPDCKALTLNTVSRRYTDDDVPEWRGTYERLWASRGLEILPIGCSNEDWYGRMGYIKWKEEPAYPVELDGRQFKLIAVFMRKELPSLKT